MIKQILPGDLIRLWEVVDFLVFRHVLVNLRFNHA
jgi:hypothetical protein